MRGHLYKYFTDRKWAEAFLDGRILFRSLAYFRDYEDQSVRGDRDEGNAIFRPQEGLIITNHTQNKTFILPGYAFQSAARQAEIFVFCLSRSFNREISEKFGASVCIEIVHKAVFCRRVTSALQPEAAFPGAAGHTRIGNDVEYYDLSEGGSPRWALPDQIALSKLNAYAWQNEFRLVFTLTDAFRFENVDTRLVSDRNEARHNTNEHQNYLVETQSLRDICRLHDLEPRAVRH